MSHTAALLDIIRKLDGDGPAEWHTTPEIAEAAADYWTSQRCTAYPSGTYTIGTLNRLRKMGKVEIANESRGIISSWRLAA